MELIILFMTVVLVIDFIVALSLHELVFSQSGHDM